MVFMDDYSLMSNILVKIVRMILNDHYNGHIVT